MHLQPGIKYTLSRENNQFGPYDSAQLLELASGGNIIPTDMIWDEQTQSWVPAQSCLQLFPPASLQPASQQRVEPPLEYKPTVYKTPPKKRKPPSKASLYFSIFGIAIGVIALGIYGFMVLGNHLANRKEIIAMESGENLPLSDRHPVYQQIVGRWSGGMQVDSLVINVDLIYKEDGTWTETIRIWGEEPIYSKGQWTVVDKGKSFFARTIESTDPENIDIKGYKSKILEISEDNFHMSIDRNLVLRLRRFTDDPD